MDDFELPDDLNDVEIIYSDSENDEEESYAQDMLDIDDDNNENVENNEPITDMAQLTFEKHTWMVFMGDVSKNGDTAITGGQDDVAYIWSTITGDVLFECTGHKDSVTHVGFNHDSQLAVTGDMNGMLQVWHVNDKKLEWCYEGDDMLWLKWHPNANVLVCGCSTGDIYVWQVPQGNCKVLPTHNNSSSTCGSVLPNGKQLLAGYHDGQLKLWNIKETAVLWTNSQSNTVTDLHFNNDTSLAIVTPMGHIVKMTDGKNVFTLPADDNLEVVRFCNEINYLVTGSLDGDVCIYDLGKQSLRNQSKCKGSVTVMEFGNDGRLFLGDSGGVIYLWDVKNGNLLNTFTGHRDAILSIKCFNNGNSILTTSADNTAKIFHIHC